MRLKPMAFKKNTYRHPFEEGKIVKTTPQAFRRMLSASKYAQRAQESGIFNNPDWAKAYIVDTRQRKPAAQANTSTNATGEQQAGTRRRQTTGHRKTRGATGQQRQTGGRQNRVNYRELTSQQLI